MPRFVSKDGVWFPAKEKVSLTNITDKVKVVDGKEIEPGDPYIYEGPDRAAEFELFQAGVKNFGIHFKDDPDLINRARQLGYKDVAEYAKAVGYDAEKVRQEFEKNAAVVTKHELPERKEGIKTFGGGRDFSGQGNDVPGAFGKPKELG